MPDDRETRTEIRSPDLTAIVRPITTSHQPTTSFRFIVRDLQGITAECRSFAMRRTLIHFNRNDLVKRKLFNENLDLKEHSCYKLF